MIYCVWNCNFNANLHTSRVLWVGLTNSREVVALSRLCRKVIVVCYIAIEVRRENKKHLLICFSFLNITSVCWSAVLVLLNLTWKISRNNYFVRGNILSQSAAAAQSTTDKSSLWILDWRSEEVDILNQLNRDSAEAHTRMRGLANAEVTGGGAVQHPNEGGDGREDSKRKSRSQTTTMMIWWPRWRQQLVMWRLATTRWTFNNQQAREEREWVVGLLHLLSHYHHPSSVVANNNNNISNIC